MLAQTYQRCKIIDQYEKNGKGYAYIFEKCDRCGGTGHMPYTAYNGVCLKCGGAGGQRIEVRDYSVAEWEKMTAAKAKREAKREAQRLAEVPQRNLDTVLKYGFKTGTIHAVAGSTYDMNPLLKDLGARYKPEIGWFFQEPTPGFITFEVTVDDVFTVTADGYVVIDPSVIQLVVDRKLAIDTELGARCSKHIGSIGQKITITAWLANTYSYDTQYGKTNIHKFIDTDGNIYKWSTQKWLNVGDTYTITGTVKDHDEYEGKLQTALTRCKTGGKNV